MQRRSPPVVDVRAASPNQAAFFSKVFTVATSNGRDVILETPEGRGEAHLGDRNNVKIARRMSTDLIPIELTVRWSTRTARRRLFCSQSQVAREGIPSCR
jgi:hypothetical protein